MGILPVVMEGMWTNARRLLLTAGVSEAPSKGGNRAFSVISDTSVLNNQVTITQKGEMSCNCRPRCRHFKIYGCCSHILAVAEKTKSLNRFIESMKNRKKGAKRTNLTTAVLNKINTNAAGKKGSKVHRSRSQVDKDSCTEGQYNSKATRI